MRVLTAVVAASSVVLAACGSGGAADEMAGTVQVDGSSTVFPVTEAVAEEYMLETGGSVRVTVGTSGTGGGFKRFCAGETDINNASRAIKDSEREACAANGVEFIELPVAYDGISVVVNPENDFAACMTVDELARIWEPESGVKTWADVREGWPAEEIRLYGPGTDSGTFDYFTEAIVGTEDASRSDYTASEDDNILVQGVTGDRYSLGYFGYAYYEENKGALKAVAVDNGAGCVAPSPETIQSGEYAPLSRPLFIYVSRAALEKPAVAEFVRYYMEAAGQLVPEVGYVPLSEAEYQENIQQLDPQGHVAE